MTGWTRLQQFLATNPSDIGCEAAMEVLHIYAELSPEERAQRYPGVLVHLQACTPCGEDFDGLLAALAAESTQERPTD